MGERGFRHADDVMSDLHDDYTGAHIITMLTCTYVLGTFLSVCFISHK